MNEERVELSGGERELLRREGWVRVPAVVPEGRRRAALRAINASLGRGLDPGKLAHYSASSFCPELRGAPALLDLFEATAARPLAESVLGRGAVLPPETAQIALRFPLPGEEPAPPLVPHIDGFAGAGNGVAPGTIYSFAALAAVFLHDVDGPWAGNFVVWPRSHLLLSDWFRRHPPDPALPHGVPPVRLGEPLQIEARAGDLLLCHYLLVHAAASNLGPHIRYAVFFRLHNAAHAGLAPQKVVGDPWQGWSGMEQAAGPDDRR